MPPRQPSVSPLPIEGADTQNGRSSFSLSSRPSSSIPYPYSHNSGTLSDGEVTLRSSFSSYPRENFDALNDDSEKLEPLYPLPSQAVDLQSLRGAYGGAGHHEHLKEDHQSPTLPSYQDRRRYLQHVPPDKQSWEKSLASLGIMSDAKDDHTLSSDGTKRGMESSKPKSNSHMARFLHGDSFSSRAIRKLLAILPLTALLWVPGLVAVLAYGASPSNNFAQPSVFNVGIFWWSVWLSLAWCMTWVLSATAHYVPRLLEVTVGNLSSQNVRNYIRYLITTEAYMTGFLWSLFAWATYLGIIWEHDSSNTITGTSPLGPFLNDTSTALASFATTPISNSTSNSYTSEIVQFGRFLLGLCICSGILLAEKLVIQSVAMSFHEVTYQDRINLAKFHVKVVSTLFANARDDLDREDCDLKAEHKPDLSSPIFISSMGKRGSTKAKGDASKQTALSFAAQQLTEGSVLSAPFSPRAIVVSALESKDEWQKLARRIFFSFAKKSPSTGVGSGRDKDDDEGLLLSLPDIEGLFPNSICAKAAFVSLDKDGNDNCTLEEIEASIGEMHHERVSLLNSMQGVDSAVAKLDGIFTSVYVIVACVIVAALLSSHVATFVASFGTALLGLSWLVSSTAQEALSAVVWVFYKHPIDVGDTVDIPDLLPYSYTTSSIEEINECLYPSTYIVEEIRLLSTVFKTSTGKYVQVANAILAQKPLVNMRRSGPIEELMKIEVWYRTPLESVEKLRREMMEWLTTQGRDFKPGLDVQIDGPGDQSGLTLVLGIRYKSNWQNTAIKARRRNRWVCKLRSLLWSNDIHGPKGDPLNPTVNLWATVDAPQGDDREPLSSKSSELMDKRKLQETEDEVYGVTPGLKNCERGSREKLEAFESQGSTAHIRPRMMTAQMPSFAYTPITAVGRTTVGRGEAGQREDSMA